MQPVSQDPGHKANERIMKVFLKSACLIFFISTLIFGCKKDSFLDCKIFKKFAFDNFELEAPSNWTSFSSQGIDSKIGGITNGRDTLHYDYGWYSYDFKNETGERHKRENTLIDGRPALVVVPKNPGNGLIGFYVNVEGPVKFNLYGNNIKTSQESILRIFNSVRFK